MPRSHWYIRKVFDIEVDVDIVNRHTVTPEKNMFDFSKNGPYKKDIP